MENKVFRVLIIILNTIGVLCLLYFGYLYLSHDTFVPNPEAMLPMERWDGGGWVLTIGLLPLFIANALGFIAFRDRRTAARFLWFVPGIVCLVLVISYWICSLVG